MGSVFRCGTDQRRALATSKGFNGIDFLEVEPEKLTLTVQMLLGVKSTPLSREMVEIAGAEEAASVVIESDPVLVAQSIVVTIAGPGDASTYTLRLQLPDDAMDPMLSEVAFVFGEDGSGGQKAAMPPRLVEPEIDYLARDYASLRRLMLDRLALLQGGGIDGQPADLQVALVELLAFTADRMSYYQDAVATEAYLGTARSRVSLRRHARLLDYPLHEGCNARLWIRCEAKFPVTVGKDWAFSTDGDCPVTFTPCHHPGFHPDHNRMEIYAWGESDYTLNAGETRATLLKTGGSPPARGELVLLSSSAGAGRAAVSHVVRLTDVRTGQDPILGKELWKVAWDAEDALPCDLAVRVHEEEVGGAFGNLLLADHGSVVEKEALAPDPGVPSLRRFSLSGGPLTYAAPLPPDLEHPEESATLTSAAGLLRRDVRAAAPSVELEGDRGPWQPRYDLLASDSGEAAFVVEAENGGKTYLRFGDGTFGLTPSPHAPLLATYRVGNGSSGNVGVGAIRRVTGTAAEKVLSVSNPLAGCGGEDPEPAEQVRLFAPQAFRRQERAIAAADYAARAQSFPGVARAMAEFRWTGSWYTVYLFVDRERGRDLDETFKKKLLRHMDGYRLAGYDVEIRKPAFVRPRIRLSFQGKGDAVPNAVQAALKDALGCRELQGGGRGYFHPDNWTFGQQVYLSHFYQAALQVPGVARVAVTEFQRQDDPRGGATRELGVIAIGPHEIIAGDLKVTEPDEQTLLIGGNA